MQISGAGHWFLEGWIGDHAVDFLVDSGSAVTTVSRSFHETLSEAGAPVGDQDLRSGGCAVRMAHRLTFPGARLAWCNSRDSGQNSLFWCVT